MSGVTSGARLGYGAMAAKIEPEPPAEDRAAILAALAGAAVEEDGWAETALLEGVDDGELDP